MVVLGAGVGMENEQGLVGEEKKRNEKKSEFFEIYHGQPTV